jgi:hypothetical protein
MVFQGLKAGWGAPITAQGSVFCAIPISGPTQKAQPAVEGGSADQAGTALPE